MQSKHIKALELDKILTMLASEASCDDTKEQALALTPNTSYIEASNLIQNTQDAYMLMCRFGAPTILAIKNMKNSLRRAAAGGVLSPIEFILIAEVLRTIRSLCEWRKRCENIETSIDYLFSSLTPNKYLEDKINNIILSEDEISDNASPELASIRRKIRNAQQRAKEQLDKVVRSSTYQKYLQDSIVTMRDGRYVVPVKAEHKNEIKGLVHDTSASGATLFIEPIGVVEANNEVKVLESAERDEIEKILRELSNETGSFADSIASCYELIIDIDLCFAKANLGARMKASVPALTNDGITILKKARHPLINPKNIVPIDISVGEEFDTLVITGPNTGGKTVSLKTLGLLTLMAMCGLMIPASDGSKICIYQNVLVDIGDEQSIEQNLSTFSAHMTNIISILNEVNEHSLVLLDELGAGTDPIEGAALAVSILEELKFKGAKIVATTHYAEIKIYALETDRIENACCEFDVATLKPTYKLLIGVPGRSNAFAISKRLGMQDEIIDRAKEMLSGESTRFEDVVRDLESSRQKYEQQREELDALKMSLSKDKKNMDLFYERLEKDKQNEIDKARYEAKKIVEQVKFESEKLISELDELRKQKDSADYLNLAARAKSELRSKIRKLENDADPVVKAKKSGYVLPRPLKAGDNVTITDINKTAIVISPPDDSGYVMVQAGILKTKIHKDNLRLDEKQKVTQKTGGGVRTVKNKATASASMDLDLRGLDSEEAIMELDKFIDNAILNGIHQVTIIHGKGTGVLRTAVQSHLRRHKCIKTFRLGVFGEGESGVTIAELK